MSWTNILNFVIDQLAAYQDLNEIKDNAVVVKEFPKQIVFGGDYTVAYTATSDTPLVGQTYAEIDGTNIGGATYELRFMGQATSGDTITVSLVNITDSSTLVTKTFTITSLDLVKSASFSLPTGTKKFRVDVRATTGGASSPYLVYGAHLVQR